MTSRFLPTSAILQFCDMKYLLQCSSEKEHQYTNYKKPKRLKYIHFLATWYAMNISLFRNLIIHYLRIALAPEHKIYV